MSYKTTRVSNVLLVMVSYSQVIISQFSNVSRFVLTYAISFFSSSLSHIELCILSFLLQNDQRPSWKMVENRSKGVRQFGNQYFCIYMNLFYFFCSLSHKKLCILSFLLYKDWRPSWKMAENRSKGSEKFCMSIFVFG